MSYRKMKFYLAGAYSRRLEILGYANRMRALGFTVTSRWLDGSHEHTGGDPYDATRDERSAWAAVDLQDVDDADAVIMFETDAATPRMRGGAHVEFGYAMAKGKQMIVVGYDGGRHHIFHALPSVVHFHSFYEIETLLMCGFGVVAE